MRNLTIPDYDGRSIVGWMGVAMLTSVLSGLYMWWPRQGGFRRGLQWSRGAGILSDLHHTAGIWIAVPLGVVSATGIFLGFPQQGRALLSSIFVTTSVERGAFAAPLLHPTARTIDQARDAAIALIPGSTAVTIALPTKRQAAWRIELLSPNGVTNNAIVDDVGGEARLADPPAASDRVALWLRWIHEGSHASPLWRVVVFLCGLSPPVLGISGIVIWLRRRRPRKSPEPREMRPKAEFAE